MELHILHRTKCQQAKGLCVVIDVLRAFTTAAFAFHSGAKEITLVGTKEEAFKKFQLDPDLLLMGEENRGLLIEGFHFGNSPYEMLHADVAGRRLVQRTSSGTQGVVGCAHADHMLVSSFVVAEATLKRIKAIAPRDVSFIVTGMNDGDEDLALAEYLKSRLVEGEVSVDPFLHRVRNSIGGQKLIERQQELDYRYGPHDLNFAVDADRFSFCMEVFKIDGHLVAKKVSV